MKKLMLPLLLVVSVLPLSGIQARPGISLSGDRDWAVTVSPFITLMGGYSDELVFDESSDPYPYLSQLTWEIKPAVVAGASFSFMYKRASFNMALGSAVNKSSGEMTDRDWIEQYFDDTDTGWTHESVSDIDFSSSLLLDVNASYRVFERRFFSTALILGYKRMEWGWTDEITSISYPVGNYDYLKGVNGIDYDVEYSIPYAGIDLALSGRRLSGGITLLYSPFVSAEDHDHHILRGLHFYENLSNGDYLGTSLYLRYIFLDWFSLCLSGDLDYIPEFKGDTKVYNESDSLVGYYPDGAGVEYLSYSVGISLGFHY